MTLRVAVLLTCFNRKAKTLACLQSLQLQKLDGIELDIHLVDDGCTDGTTDAVRSNFPQVQLIAGNGCHYWNGGMRLCWLQALRSEHDFYLWLNDDVTLANDAVQRLVECYTVEQQQRHDTQQWAVGAVVGTMRDPDSGHYSYGGRRKLSQLHPLLIGPVLPATDQTQLCDYINGNLCLIPKLAVQTIGILSDKFTHSMGDFDYGIRLRHAGLQLLVAPGVFGICALNPRAGSIMDPQVPFATRLRMMRDPAKCPPESEWLWFVRQHGGPIWPLLYLKAWFGRRFPLLWLWFNQRKTPHQLVAMPPHDH